jgi:hypothetical protein
MLLDVTLPGASSREVLEEAERLRPDLVTVLTSVVRQKFHDIRWRGSWRRFVDLAAVRFPISGVRSGGDGGAVGKTWGLV